MNEKRQKRRRPRQRKAAVPRDPAGRPAPYKDDALLADFLRRLPGRAGDDRPLVRAMLAWRHGNPAGAVDAVRFCGEHRRPLPDALWRWILPALEAHVRMERASAASGKGRYATSGNEHDQHRQTLWSWRALREARARGLKGDFATAHAAKDLAACGIHIGPKAIANGFREVERWLRYDSPSRLRVIRRFYPDDESNA